MTATATRTRPRLHLVRPSAGGDASVRPAHYMLLLATVAVLNVIGVVMVLSASSVLSLTTYGSAWYFFERQLVWTLIGVIGFAVALRIDYRRWRDWVHPMLFVTTTMLLLVLVPHVGIYVSGSRRWLGIGAWRFQPTELAKFTLILFAADLLTRRKDEIFDWRRSVRPVGIVVLGLGALVFLEPDLDSTILIAVIAAAVLVAAGVRLRHLATIGVGGLSLTTILALSAPYRRARLLTFLHPTADAANGGYQIVQSLIALGSGGINGVGLGAGRSKWLFLPNAHTDFIFAVIGEELGLIGTLTVLALFTAFAILGLRTALRAPDRFGMLLATGITMWVVAQAAVNIGGVVGLLPVSGVPLPFVSFGGSALVFTMIAAGVLANVARQSR